MHHRHGLLVGALLAVALATGCASTAPGSSTAPAATDVPAPGAGAVTSAPSELTERGNMPAEIGQRIGSWGPPMAPEIGQYFTISAIKPAPKCQQAAGTDTPVPENGRFLAVSIKIENTAAYDTAQPGYYTATAQKWDYVAADGTAYDEVDTLPAFYCTGKPSPFPSAFAPGRTYTGTVYVDVPKGAGVLVFGQGPNTGPGYEYAIT